MPSFMTSPFDPNTRPSARWSITRSLSRLLRRTWHALGTSRQARIARSASRLAEPAKREQLLSEVRTAIRLGLFEEATTMLARFGDVAMSDADCLNLLGVIDEARCSWKSARRWYGKAIRRDRSHAAAQQNMRRIYELHTFGESKQPTALGDERPALCQLLNERERSSAIGAVGTMPRADDEIYGNTSIASDNGGVVRG